MKTIDTRSSAIARLHLQSAIRSDGDPLTLYRTTNVHKQGMVTESLRMLGFDVEAGSPDFDVPPAHMPDESSTIILTKTGLEKLNAVLKDFRPQ